MAKKNGRLYLGCDISAEYVAIAQERLAKCSAVSGLFNEVYAMN
jgi:DNA modification methylase